ncbi:conserved exported hypothetical protein [Candidatus Accumulibacter aalborgensis]|uniref:Uncharacterized protein n=1 Tax=Candidatus Accumulibacter aalborgensis TaxID=1860102 RepID=A0A1A8XJM0_9PROT|nr:conserved exported hypothetical protein [Candidatus Accumulibacter aalborgensis]
MIISKFALVALALAGCAAGALAVSRRPGRLEKRRLEEGLRTWEDEGGSLAPSVARATVRSSLALLSPDSLPGIPSSRSCSSRAYQPTAMMRSREWKPLR